MTIYEQVYTCDDAEGRTWRVACWHRLTDPQAVGLEVWPARWGDERGRGKKNHGFAFSRTEMMVLISLAQDEISDDRETLDEAAHLMLLDLLDRSAWLRAHLDEMWSMAGP